MEDTLEDKDDKYVEANVGVLLPGECSKDYTDWTKSKAFEKHFGKRGLTNAQHRFADWLFAHKEVLYTVGNMEDVFLSIRRYLKHLK